MSFHETPDHHAIYHAKEIHTLSHALLVHASLPQPILRFRQTLYMKLPDYDTTYSGCITYDVAHHILRIRFPTECYGYIRRIQNSRRCRMVTYWEHPETGFVREVELTEKGVCNAKGRTSSELSLFCPMREPVLYIYTGGYDDLTVSFDVYLVKRVFGAQAKL
jgi:hypothetical protein